MSRDFSSPLSARGGPYPSTTAGLGGLPTVSVDVPICAVLLLFYLSSAVTNVTIFRLNRSRNHKFVLSMLLFGFSMARINTLILRIAWATRPHNIRLAIAAQIFVNAGILLVYIVNVILAQRILRAMQPQIGWNPFVRATYKVLYVAIGASLAMVIASVVISLYTLSPSTKSTCRSIQLAALTYLLIFATLPLLHILVSVLLPNHKKAETFGRGSMRSKLIILTISTLICMLIAGFKAGVSWSPPRPARNPAWFDSKACFYVFNFACEVSILALLIFSRFDRRFWVPDGCNAPGDYSRLKLTELESMEMAASEVEGLEK